MNYLRIRLILSFYKTFYVDKQTLIRTSHIREISKHHRILTRLKDSLIELSPDLTEQEISTINHQISIQRRKSINHQIRIQRRKSINQQVRIQRRKSMNQIYSPSNQ